MAGWKNFLRLIHREITLWKLRRETDRRRQVWLHTRLTMKHSDEFVRHRKSTAAVLDYLSAAEDYDRAKSQAR